MAVPVVAIVGRPNVGKSSLFNWLAGRRISIVDPTAGVTRDRVSTLIKVGERFCELVDTGGIGIEDVDNLTADVERQISTAIESATLILFVVDVRSGIVPLDEEVADRLRTDKPVLLVVNKCDGPEIEYQAAEFRQFGFSAPVCVSAEQKRGREELSARIQRLLPETELADQPQNPTMHFTVVGRQNAGKSTFINSLAQSERMIVSEVAGTTRDSVDVRFQRDGKTYVAIDTAGIKRDKNIVNDVEWYSLARAQRSIRRADVVFHFFDPRLRIAKVDKTIAEYTMEQHKPTIFVVNKWDLAKAKMPTERFATYLRKMIPMLEYVPIAFITAKNGKNVQKLVDLAQNLFKQATARVGTGDLNRVLRQAIQDQPPPMRINRRPKIFYATQVATSPPTIVLFTNGPELFDQTYVRYLHSTFRDALPFREVPINLHFRAKKRDERSEDGTMLDEEDVAERAGSKRASRPRTQKHAGDKKRGKPGGGEPRQWEF